MPREPEAKTKCPVCRGTGKAFDHWEGISSDKPCWSCEGTGLPPWSAAFKKLVESGIIHVPRTQDRPSLPAKLPIHVEAAQYTTDYDGYVRRIREAGLEPYQRDAIGNMIRKYKEAGYPGLDWSGSWPTELDNILAVSESYGHFIWLTHQYNLAHQQQLPIQGPYAARNRLAKRSNEWITGSYTMIMVQPPYDVRHAKAFRAVTASIISGGVFHAFNWHIYNNNTGETIGTTLDLQNFMNRTSFVVKARVNDYLQWLQERP